MVDLSIDNIFKVSINFAETVFKLNPFQLFTLRFIREA